jgi:transcriptional regulator with XRE-family HTH domain
MRFLIAKLQPRDPYCLRGSELQDSNPDISHKFDGEGFFSSLESVRSARSLTWKKVAEQSKVPASTLTRMSQGRKPDVDSLTALCAWSGLRADDFMTGDQKKKTEPLAELTGLFRADPNLSKQGAEALEAIIKSAYEQIRKIPG